MPAEKDKKGDPESYFFFRPVLFVLNNIGTRKEGEKVIWLWQKMKDIFITQAKQIEFQKYQFLYKYKVMF